MESASTIGPFKIGRTLGDGVSCKVKMGYDTSNNNKKVAIKILKKDMSEQEKELVRGEIQAMENLRHNNIIEILSHGTEEYKKPNGKSRSVDYIALELAPRGVLFDFVSVGGPFPEDMARHWFKQFINGLDYCHQQGIFHRDIKPENLLVDDDYNLRIADFGFAKQIAEMSPQMMTTHLGTEQYMAPEIHLGQEYQGSQVDLFASGVVLFIMVSGHPPFSAASPKDSYYKALALGKQELFWKQHLKQSDEQVTFSDEFRDLIGQMLQLDPNERPTMEQLKETAWYTGNTPSNDDIRNELENRSQQVQEQNDAERAAKSGTKDTRTASHVGVRRSAEGEEFSDEDKQKEADKALLKPQKILQQYEGDGNQKNLLNVITSFNPDIIEGDIIQYLVDQKIDPTVDQKKYKIKFEFSSATDHLKNKNYKVKVCIRILKVDEEQVCVEFTKIAGPLDKYTEIVQGLKTSNCLANVVA